MLVLRGIFDALSIALRHTFVFRFFYYPLFVLFLISVYASQSRDVIRRTFEFVYAGNFTVIFGLATTILLLFFTYKFTINNYRDNILTTPVYVNDFVGFIITLLIFLSISIILGLAIGDDNGGTGSVIYNYIGISGSIPVLLLFISIVTWALYFLARLSNRHGIPATLIFLAWIIIGSALGTKFPVRFIDGGEGQKPRPKLIEIVDEWKASNRKLVFVAASGGGIRAAYWTQIVLKELSGDKNIALISSVSGGTFGAASFIMERQSKINNHHRENFESDFLAFSLSGMLFSELAYKIIYPVYYPFRNKKIFGLEIYLPNSGDVLAEAFNNDWAKYNGYNKPLSELAKDDMAIALVANSTDVFTGKRVLTSSISLDEITVDSAKAVDLIGLTYLENPQPSEQNLKISEVVINSARFPLISPAALFDPGASNSVNPLKLVDGGYFDNIGAETLFDIISSLDPNTRKRVVVYAIFNSPDIKTDSGSGVCTFKSVAGEPNLTEWFGGLRTPLKAVFSSWDAHGLLALQRIADIPDVTVRLINLGDFLERKPKCDLPLGWTLSKCAREAMNTSLDRLKKKSLDYCQLE